MKFKIFHWAKINCLVLLVAAVFLQCKSTKNDQTWLEKLPNCPCENPDKNGVKPNDGWAADKGNYQKYHRGAAASFRSYPFVKTTVGKSGQQCCYDSDGRLITEGSGAGTPDKVATCRGEDKNGAMKVRFGGLLGHFRKDVKPWNKAGGEAGGWEKYNLTWKPNNGKGCPPNKKQ